MGTSIFINIFVTMVICTLLENKSEIYLYHKLMLDICRKKMLAPARVKLFN